MFKASTKFGYRKAETVFNVFYVNLNCSHCDLSVVLQLIVINNIYIYIYIYIYIHIYMKTFNMHDMKTYAVVQHNHDYYMSIVLYNTCYLGI